MGTLTFSFSPARAFSEEDRLIDESIEPPPARSPDWAETKVARPSPPRLAAFGPITPAARQPMGALTGKIIFMNGGHGWTFDPDRWRLLRPVLNEMNEDYGNIDQMNMFAAYCFNAGAVVVPLRPLGQQTNEVVLDNDDPGVTTTGTWEESTSPIFYGGPGDVPYRFAALASTETATATYTPTIPAAGFYPVYTWVRHGVDRADQLYRIMHTGGESQIRIPHYKVGNGWVYLGEYYFNAGANATNGSVIVSNLRGSAIGSYTFADAIRFGNGMGSVDRGGGVSGYPREDESSRYWVQTSLGQGQLSTLYDGAGNDESDSWSAPPKMSAEMNREEGGSFFDRVHVSFHSNAGGGRGTLGLITSDPTPNQSILAQLAGKEVNDDLVALGAPPLEVPWNNRSTFTYTGGYSEIDGSLFNNEMAATIIEVAFHDNVDDARLLRDSKARAAVGKAAMHAIIKYFHQLDGLPLNFLPEPPTNLRAIGGVEGKISLRWTAPPNVGGSGTPTGYTIYRSTDGYGFGTPLPVGNVLGYTITNLPGGEDYYFRIAAVNAGGESMPSEVVACRTPTASNAARALVVNGFDRFNRTTNLRQDTTPRVYSPPDATGAIERVWPRRVNAFDYVVTHGKAIDAFGMAFDSCQNEAVANGQVALTDYPVVVWAAGQESTADETFNSPEQTKVAEFRNAGGHLFVSGSEIAWDLDRSAGPTPADRAFFNAHLKADFISDSNDNSLSYTVTPTTSGIFAGRGSTTFDDGSRGIYWVQTPDVLTPFGNGVVAALNYTGNANGAAAIQYDGTAGGGRVVLCGFPFETIGSETRRSQYMADVLSFFSARETLVAKGSTWRFDDSSTNLGTAWRTVEYNDSSWPSGPAQLGFGENDEAQTVAPDPARITTYFRHRFNLPNARDYRALTLRVLRDDGAVIWLNGVEVLRSNMPATGLIEWGTGAVSDIAAADENLFDTFLLDARLLRTGANVVGVELHQFGNASDDLSFDLELLATRDFVGSLIAGGSSWKYRDSGIPPAAEWKTREYNDSGWPNGFARFGYGGDGEITAVGFGNDTENRFRTTWFRHTFSVTDSSVFDALRVELQRDDGAVVYLNGVELVRDNLSATAVGSETLATTSIEPPDETAWHSFIVPAFALVNGNNVLAVEIHQATPNSNDLGFDLRLLGLAQSAMTYGNWQAASFGTDGANPVVAHELADPDADGAGNVAEYALGGNAMSGNAEPLTRVDNVSGRLLLRFMRNPLARDVNLTVQAADSADGPWIDLARSSGGDAFQPLMPEATVSENVLGGTRAVEAADLYSMNDPAHPRRFMRLQIVR